MTEIKKLTSEKETLGKQNDVLERRISLLNNKLEEREEELAMSKNDKMRFKELSEGYMEEVARLEAQLEAADMKPKSKLSQRPKDTVLRD